MKLIWSFLTIFMCFAVSSCMNEKNYFPMKEGKNISYDIYFTDKENKKSYVEECLSNEDGPILASSDYMRLYSDQIRP